MDGMSHESPLVSEVEPPVGAHIVTPRRGYAHHGIYVGLGRVVHFGGFSRGLWPQPVEEVSLSDFAQGRLIRLHVLAPALFERAEVVRRARLRLGEGGYNLFTNNCEHFCEWCLRDQPQSHQVRALLSQWRRRWREVMGLLSKKRGAVWSARKRWSAGATL
jgi:hypothetical protein